MDEDDLRTRFREDRIILECWGEFVTDWVTNQLARHLGGDQKASNFLKVPALPRVKDDESFIRKALYRGYPWGDPYSEIMDKVGTRFVVLLLEHIPLISGIVQSGSDWSCEQSRDFEKEKEESPTIFSYQSVHFIVKANKCLLISGTIIPEGTPCEVQIRTLMQHAFSEVSHDTVYKTLIKASPELQRTMAKCVAFIEATDEKFGNVDVGIKQAEAEFRQKLASFEELYRAVVHQDAQLDVRACAYMYEKMEAVFNSVNSEALNGFIARRPNLGKAIEKRLSSEFLYTQPLIIPLLYAVERNSRDVENSFPYMQSRLEPMLTDMGIGSID